MRFLVLLAALSATGLGISREPPPPAPPRLPARPLPTAAEAKVRATELRKAYSRKPSEWPKPTLDEGAEHRELGLLPEVKHPKDNPYSKDKAELGRALFFDGRLSGAGQAACASCHDPDLAWADGRTTSFGHDRKPLKRNAPSVHNVAFATSFFWDGRSDSLEAQAKAVLANPDEMRADEKGVVGRLTQVKGYPPLFEKAFGDGTVTLDRVSQALACFQRTLVGGRSRFDAFLKGKTDVLTDAEVRGLHLFRTDARCLHCHNGPTLSDGKFHDIGLSYYGRELEDLGRFRVTKVPADVGAFRTPPLRNVGRTGPYMHNGLFELEGLLRMYNAGGATIRKTDKFKDDPNFPTKSRFLKPLGLNALDLDDLEAFLRSLDEPHLRVRPPAVSLPDARP
ncbi:Cytochrome c551 peroxidase precursor [Gemmata obscuriglobus]|uniref:Methylamine utilization protein MauG n=1 Tax=Gemmata obscuriglobus TaxID=114 RepID=A0A2Z3GZB8_9BACT|nr:cytochrome c peroxidase [Gemmata obscuriglobus]AWM38021.1 cytochrome-c peroxidase [Gemmata obscuriglobus]QEG29111.1 Cytochrome c551 peroxidase precursor [Gemmata obscuriglobus]VTS07797.1 cytochrome c peroxidase : Cytochrome-c peroxidase OS=Planctomyces brasiliensis (strain ATCC 49424 / DSM 5305 / JCM 21570 / NBRC 103401 / IFAM 1448) GN=Plabr_3898 PE=4 SV=1: CCP_MauG [Gemmata obscuriglobus UQM 2246]